MIPRYWIYRFLLTNTNTCYSKILATFIVTRLRELKIKPWIISKWTSSGDFIINCNVRLIRLVYNQYLQVTWRWTHRWYILANTCACWSSILPSLVIIGFMEGEIKLVIRIIWGSCGQVIIIQTWCTGLPFCKLWLFYDL